MAFYNRVRGAGKTLGSAAARAIVTSLILSVVSGAVALARKKNPLVPPPADVPGHVNYLARQLTGVELDDAEPVTSQIQTLVFDDVQQWLGQHPPLSVSLPVTTGPAGAGGSKAGGEAAVPTGVADDVPYDVKVRRVMDHDFSRLHYPWVGQPAVFAQSWKDGLLVGAGYMLGWTDQDRTNVIAFFEVPYGAGNAAHRTQPAPTPRPARPARLAAVAHFVAGCDLHYAFPVPSGGVPAGAFWVLVYGTRLGKSHPRLSATLYSFDGEQVKSLWQTRDAYDGSLIAEGDRVVIRHMNEWEFVQAATLGQAAPRYEAIYKITPAGLQLESDRQMKQ